MCVNVKAFADDKKGDEDKKAKKETKYDKLFKDKKKETASSKFITVHKCDGKLYLEVPVKYLHKEMLLGGGISSTTDPTYLPSVPRASPLPTSSLRYKTVVL